MLIMRIPIILLFLFNFTSEIPAQISSAGTPKNEVDIEVHRLLSDMAFYSDVMINAENADHRIRAHRTFQELMNGFLSTPESYHRSLDSIRWISVLKSNDFRIVTWQLRLSDQEYKYGGFIQWPDKLVELKDSRPWLNGSLRNTYLPDAWYGALYYKLIPFRSGKNDAYILFGFNAENSMINTKVVDVLTISDEGVKLGLPVFNKNDETQTRLILTYADASTVQLVYDEESEAIIHDHIEQLSIGPEGEMLGVSDGSQEGWILKNGKWKYEEEMYDVKSEFPPFTDERKDRKEDKDLFGRPRKD